MHVYTDGSADKAIRNGGSGVYVRTPTGQTYTYSNAIGRTSSNFKVEALALQTAAACIAERKPDKTVVLTDSKAALQSLTSDVLQTRRSEDSHNICGDYHANALQSYSGSQLSSLWDSRKYRF